MPENETQQHRRQDDGAFLRAKLAIEETAKEERQVSDNRYAIKLVERIVFTAMGVIALAVLTALIALVIRK